MFKKMSLMVFVLLLSICGKTFAQSNDTTFSFSNKNYLNDIAAGKLTKSIRLKDRTAAPYLFASGKKLSLINSNTTEDARTAAEQVKDNAYGKVEITNVVVSEFSKLNASEQAELKLFYTDAQISEAKNIVTIITFKFIK